MAAVKIDVRCGDPEGIALLQIAVARIDRLYEYLIAAGAELLKIKAAVYCVKIEARAVRRALNAREPVAVEVSYIDIDPLEGLIRAYDTAYLEAAAAKLVFRCEDLRKLNRSRRGACAAVLRRCVAENRLIAWALAALDHVVYAVALDGIYRRRARTLDDGDVLGKPVARAVGLKAVDKQQVARLRGVFPRAPQAALLKPAHAAGAAGKVRDNALGNARVSRAPADEHGAPRLIRQAVPCAVFRSVRVFFAVAELSFGNGHEALPPASGRVCKRRRDKAQKQHERKDKAQ